jgi:hypothetical protein
LSKLSVGIFVTVVSIMPLRSYGPTPALADEKPLSSLCGSGYGGSFVYPYYTAYTTSSPCASKYLACTVYSGSNQYSCGTGWSAYDIVVDINPADSVAATHRICNDVQSICSLWTYTADS